MRPTQAEWAGGRLGGHLDPAEGIHGTAVSNPIDLATLHTTGKDPNPAVGLPIPAPFWLDPSFRP